MGSGGEREPELLRGGEHLVPKTSKGSLRTGGRRGGGKGLKHEKEGGGLVYNLSDPQQEN